MKSPIRLAFHARCCLLVVLLVGCTLETESPSTPAASTAKSKQAAPSAARSQRLPPQSSTPTDRQANPTADKPFKLGDLIEPFTPPPLAELDKTAEWIDNPVQSGMEIMRKKQEALGPPPLSVEEALKLRNDSPEDNAKILGTLSRLAPPDDKGVDFEATFVRHTAADLKSSNPLLYSSITEGEFNSLTGAGFFSFDQNMDFFCPSESVVSWQTSKDHMMDKVVMRDDLTWSDGKPITAHDVEFSFKVIMTDGRADPRRSHGNRPAQMGRSLRRSHDRVLPQGAARHE